MDDENLILGVLAAQVGFVTPAQVMAAASARMLARDKRSLLDHLVDSGALTPARRDLVRTIAAEALAAQDGSADRVLDSLDGARALSRTLGSERPAGAPARPPPAEGTEFVPDERVGQYARLDELGRGGQSIVWRALDRFVGREVALKELTSPGGGDSPGSPAAAQARFLREARLTAQLDHPGIPPVHELARRADGTLYSAQKLVRGRTLKAALAQCRTLRQRLELLPHLVNAAQAVAYAHGQSVIHRDLKPSNVIVGPYGETAVVDWGLAKRRGEPEPRRAKTSPDSGPELTQEGVALGTPSYMSPEQARGDLDAIDERSDVFSLGAMLYELLTGRSPFQGADNAQVMEAVLRARPVPVRTLCPEAPPELAAIAQRALRGAPAERYPDAGAFAKELQAHMAGARVAAYAYSPLELARKFVKRNPALSAAIATSFLILIAAGVAVLVELRQARVQLADTLVQRARRAEDVSDWARAAAYYAASRVQNDSMAARWGIALARERLPERERTHTGPPGAFSDVDVLPDGTLVALETRDNTARLYAVATGRILWTVEGAERIRDARISSGAVRLSTGRSIRVLDEGTGKERFTSDPEHETLCRNGPPTPAGRSERSAAPREEGAEGPFIQVALGGPCAVSNEGDRLASRDPNGVVRLWDLDQKREITSRAVPDTQEIVFTAHGVALVRVGSLQLFGGPEGDYSIDLPGRSVYGSVYAPGRRGVAVSADGHRVVVDDPTLDRADVLDLRDRAVFVSFTRPPGKPSYAFSVDGSKLYAGGLADGRALFAWNLQRAPARAQGLLEGRVHLEAARERFILFENRRRVEVRSEDGSLLRTIVDPDELEANLSADGSTLAIAHPEDILIQRVDDEQELARVPCKMCLVILLSADGSRLAGISRERRRVWDVRGPSLVRDEPMGAADLSLPFTLSPTGDRLGWMEGNEFVLEDLSSGSVRRLALPARADGASISPDGTRVVISFPGEFGLWKVPGMERVWTFPYPSSIPAAVGWSADGSTVTVAYEGAGAFLLDGRTGVKLARIVAYRTGTGASVNVLPSLRFRISRGPRSWVLRPLPRPDTLSPEDSLRRALTEGGFRLLGAEIEAVSP